MLFRWLFVLIFVTVAGLRFSSANQTSPASVYVGGDFVLYPSGGGSINGIGAWDNVHQRWDPLPNSPKAIGLINAIAANGTILYIGGEFNEVNKMKANSIVRYDSVARSWESLCDGVHGTVSAVAVVGDLVYVGGDFQLVPECEASGRINNVASFNVATRTWDDLSGGIPGAQIDALAVQQQGNVTYLYVTGLRPDPKCAAGALCPPVLPFIWYHSGSNWIDMASTPSDHTNRYYTIAVNPYSQQVYVGGYFRTIGGGPLLYNLAVWSAEVSQWSTLAFLYSNGDVVYSIDFIDSDQLVVGGSLQQASGLGNETLNNLALWNGTAWQELNGGGVTHVSPDLCDTDAAYVKEVDVMGEILFVGGRFSRAGPLEANNVAFYNLTSQEWVTLANDSRYVNTVIYTAAVGLDESGLPVLFIAGQAQLTFTYEEFTIDMVIFSRFHDNVWEDEITDLLEGFLAPGSIRALAQNGTDIYVGGKFITDGTNSQILRNIAKWDGSSWSPLNNGLHGATVYAMAVKGDTLYVGGEFHVIDSSPWPSGDPVPTLPPLSGIAAWSATTSKWDSLDGGLRGDCVSLNSVLTLTVSQQDLYIGGSFASVGRPTNDSNGTAIILTNLARWNFATERWLPLDSYSPGNNINGTVRSLVINATTLYVGGMFSLQRSTFSAQNLALLDVRTVTWMPFEGVQLDADGGVVTSMLFANNMMVIGGTFQMVDQTIVSNIALWQDSQWQSLGGGFTGDSTQSAEVNALGYDADNDVLYAGGVFSSAANGQTTLFNVAYWEGLAHSDGNGWNALGINKFKSPGPVWVIDVVPTDTEPVLASSTNTKPDIRWLLIIGGSALGVILLVIIIAIFTVRHLRPGGAYVKLPVFLDDNKPVNLRELTNDGSIRQIQPSELQLGERLAFGASGEVLLGQWRARQVVVKRMGLAQNQITDKFKDDFLFEIKLMSSLNHENILQFLGSSISDSVNEVYLVMEYMENGSLKDVLMKTGGRLDWKLKIRLAVDAARGIAHLHSMKPPIIHRDIKSSNLLVDRKWRCKVSDFGISRIKPNTTQTMTLVGTPAYMAPEVISKNKYSEKSDAYSFGVVLAELCSGEQPYSDIDLLPQQVMYAVVHEGLRPTIPPSCPIGLQVLIKDCLNAEPSFRPDFAEIKERLKRLA